MTNRVKLKVGNVELEYEGNKEYDLHALMKEAVAAQASGKFATEDLLDESEEQTKKGNGGSPSKVDLTTEAIAIKIAASHRNDVILAACLQLHFVQGKKVFSLNEIRQAAKTATGFYAASNHGKNLPQILKSLQKKNKLNSTTGGYSLTREEIDRIKPVLVK